MARSRRARERSQSGSAPGDRYRLEHGSLALAVRAALDLVHIPSAQNGVDLKLLGELCAGIPPENNTEYRREAQTLLGQTVAPS